MKESLCDTCRNSINGIICKKKKELNSDGMTQSEFIKILGGNSMNCPKYEKESNGQNSNLL